MKQVPSVATDIDEQLPAVLAELGLLERVVANVLHNALTHGRTPGHDPDLLVQASQYAGRVELRVIDHGPGLPKHTADTLFEPLQRFDDRNHAGIGLGLHVAKGFTEAMNGEIRAEDTPDGGLTIAISLPAAVTQQENRTELPGYGGSSQS